MLPANHTIFLRTIFFSVFLLLCSTDQSAAHIEKGSMPDSVAEMEYRILLEFEPDNLEIRNQLGMVLYRLGKLAEAEEEFHFVLKQAPENFDAFDALGLVNFKRTNYQIAVALFKKAIAINPADMLVYYHLGQALEQLDQVAEAAAAYRTGISLEAAGPHKQSNAEQRQLLLEALKNLLAESATAEDHNQ